jgi:DNA-binding beta-propeller fold protein YncE
MLASAAVYISLGFLGFPPGEEIGAMSAVAIGKADEIYVLHRGPKPLMAFDRDGKFLRSWGEGLFEVAHGLRVAPDGAIWTTDNKNNLLRKFSPEGKLLQTIEAGFKAPDDLVFASTGEIVVADAGNARLVKLSPAGKIVAEWGKKGTGPGAFAAAHGLAIDSRDRIYVADRGNNRVQAFSLGGKLIANWSGFGNPFGLIVVGNELLVSDGDANRISHLSLTDGKVVGQWGDGELLQLPHVMSLDSRGTLYVAEVNGKRVQKFRRK